MEGAFPVLAASVVHIDDFDAQIPGCCAQGLERTIGTHRIEIKASHDDRSKIRRIVKSQDIISTALINLSFGDMIAPFSNWWTAPITVPTISSAHPPLRRQGWTNYSKRSPSSLNLPCVITIYFWAGTEWMIWYQAHPRVLILQTEQPPVYVEFWLPARTECHDSYPTLYSSWRLMPADKRKVCKLSISMPEKCGQEACLRRLIPINPCDFPYHWRWGYGILHQ